MKELYNRFKRNPLSVVLIYALFGFLWIKFSDQFLETLVTDTEMLTQLQTWKGWLFILVTSSLLYVLVVRSIARNVEHEREQREFMLHAPIPLIILGESKETVFVNELFTETFGYTVSDIATAEIWWEKAYPDEDYRKTVMAQWGADYFHEDDDDSNDSERVFTIADKYGHNHEVRFFVIYQEQSTIIICQDITQKLHLEKQIRQSEKMHALGLLAGGIAHDFNNQLNVISGYNEIIEMDEYVAKNHRDSIDAIKSAVAQSNDLTSQLLMFSRDSELVMSKINLAELLDAVVSIVTHTFQNSIKIEYTPAGTELYVKGNKSQLQNVLLNLAINARDAMRGKGTIKLVSSYSDEVVVIEISDTGGGIPETVLPHIFEPFYTTKEEGKGTGMGLATAYSTIEQHHGSITVDSKKGVGTTFRITLPCK